MKILFAASENSWGGFFDIIRSQLPHHCFEATGNFHIDSLKGIDVLIPTMSAVNEKILESADRLKLIQQCGSGLESVNIEAARKKNIQVCNVPTDISGNADSVAELGIFMMIGLSRNIPGMAKSMANRRMGEPQGISLQGRTAGIIGLGGIGKALIRKLKTFDMRIIGITRSNTERAKNELGLEWTGTPDEISWLLKESDYVILSLPLTDESRNMINADTISYVKEGAFVINLSRGGVINKEALENSLAAGKVAGAGLDVFWKEPPDPSDSIFRYNVMATPHIGGSTDVSMKGIVKVVAENIRRLENNQPPLYSK
ncbi:2-hydroxyacid dehydrogenase [uncultured Desulfobacter sp.]|uniref:2-hydroxyacid dehydrogenase n=1 Tax=uncultured Desulfobacter sp. TaxID=240139 RepID=UPI002AAAABA7|nr:2-hydroxyacid dehydrogenase [uncultured Desulfobacter sp.]